MQMAANRHLHPIAYLGTRIGHAFSPKAEASSTSPDFGHFREARKM